MTKATSGHIHRSKFTEASNLKKNEDAMKNMLKTKSNLIKAINKL